MNLIFLIFFPFVLLGRGGGDADGSALGGGVVSLISLTCLVLYFVGGPHRKHSAASSPWFETS
jgi:hypothetical protein